jgi:hypothetical protein
MPAFTPSDDLELFARCNDGLAASISTPRQRSY